MLTLNVSAASTVNSEWGHSDSSNEESALEEAEGKKEENQDLGSPVTDSAMGMAIFSEFQAHYPCYGVANSPRGPALLGFPRCPDSYSGSGEFPWGAVSDDPMNPEFFDATPAGRWLKSHGAQKLNCRQVANFILRCEPSQQDQIINLLVREKSVIMENGQEAVGPLFSTLNTNCAISMKLADARRKLEEELNREARDLLNPDVLLGTLKPKPFPPYPCYVRPYPQAVDAVRHFVATYDRGNERKLNELLNILNEYGLQSNEFKAAWHPYRDSLKSRSTCRLPTSMSPCCSLAAIASLTAVATAASLTYMWRQ